MTYLLLWLIAWGGVFAKSYQQLNVAGGHKRRVFLTSYIQALSLVYTTSGILEVINNDGLLLLAVLASGTGGWMGCYCAMDFSAYLNKRIENGKDGTEVRHT